MIYLFNSAYREGYLRNVLNTLFLPSGCTNEYRYRIRGTRVNVDPNAVDKFKEAKAGTDILITYIDRFGSGGYIYHPLRRGTLVSCYEDNNYLFFRVRFGNFIYPLDTAGFNKRFPQALEPLNLPHLQNGDPEEENDGYYAIEHSTIADIQSECLTGDNAWTEIVGQLTKVQAFKSTEDKQFVFVRCVLCKHQGKKKIVEPKLISHHAIYRLARDAKYQIELSYTYPIQAEHRSEAAIVNVLFGDSLCSLENNEQPINMFVNKLCFPFTTRKNSGDAVSKIKFAFSLSGNGSGEIVGPDAALSIELKEPVSFWIKLVSAFLLLSVTGAISATSFDTVHPLTLGKICPTLWPRIVTAAPNAMAMILLFRWFGKKPS